MEVKFEDVVVAGANDWLVFVPDRPANRAVEMGTVMEISNNAQRISGIIQSIEPMRDSAIHNSGIPTLRFVMLKTPLRPTHYIEIVDAWEDILAKRSQPEVEEPYAPPMPKDQRQALFALMASKI